MISFIFILLLLLKLGFVFILMATVVQLVVGKFPVVAVNVFRIEIYLKDCTQYTKKEKMWHNSHE